MSRLYLSPCLFNLHAENIMNLHLIYMQRNAGLDEAQAGIKIVRRNINHLRYVDNTTLMAESKEELKSLLMKVKEEGEKVGLKPNIQKIRSWHLVPSVQFSSVTQSCLTLYDLINCSRQASLSITNSRSSSKLLSIESMMHSAISFCVIPFSSCSQSLPASESFPMSQLFS